MSGSFKVSIAFFGLAAAGVCQGFPSAKAQAAATADSSQTILFIRHGEKPEAGLGQLNCRGLNRSLALPGVLRRKYHRLDAIFAPDPSQQKPDGPGDDDADREAYDYVRPLATAEPTAVAFGLPIRSDFGFRETAKLKAALDAPAYRNANVLVAWEHHMIRDLVRDMLGSLGAPVDQLPDWKKKDFDSIWRVTITRTGASAHAVFAHEHQGLDNLPETCPGASTP